MFLKRLLRLRHTLAFRLTFWYALIFVISSSLAFLVFYYLVTTAILNRTDQDLREKVRTFSSILTFEGIDSLQRQAVLEAQAAGEKKIFFRLLYANGQVFSSSNMSYWRNISVRRVAIQQLLAQKRPVFDTLVMEERKSRIRILYAVIGPGMILQIGQSMEIYTRLIEAFEKIFITTTISLFFIAAVVGWFMARRALSGVESVTRTARQITETNLEERVPVKKREDEIDQLAQTFNQMLDRIQDLIMGIKEMSDNIAHDLKSPITRIRGIAEITLTTGQSPEEYETMAASIIEECDRLLQMINTMLMISKTEAGLDKPMREKIDIGQVVENACNLFRALAEDKEIRLLCQARNDAVILGDIRLIQRMIANLLDNALKYTPAYGTVAIAVDADDGQSVQVTVEDTGIGISALDLPHVFERFYRGDPSRSQSGTGLGLSFARTVARAHGGDIRVSSTPEKGTKFTVNLPAVTE